jgi:hypothetical protein
MRAQYCCDERQLSARSRLHRSRRMQMRCPSRSLCSPDTHQLASVLVAIFAAWRMSEGNVVGESGGESGGVRGCAAGAERDAGAVGGGEGSWGRGVVRAERPSGRMHGPPAKVEWSGASATWRGCSHAFLAGSAARRARCGEGRKKPAARQPLGRALHPAQPPPFHLYPQHVRR